MSEDKFAAIIVGAGPAGSTAAYLLAREGLEVLLIEKGATPGSKNMFGGRMYSHALNRIIPNFWEYAPVERPVAREIITFLNGGHGVSIDCQNLNWVKPPYHSFTLLRAEFDDWLASKAEEEGAMLACGIRVDDLLFDKGRVVGIRAGEDEMLADVIIAADGVNSIVAQKAGLAKMFLPHQVATGVKQVIKLSPETISQRFGLDGNNGAAQLFVGDCTEGMQGGGFLYTNKSTLSLGLVIKASELQKTKYKISDLIEDFKDNPQVKPLVEGGEVVEYSAHLVPEAGLEMMPQLCGDGILVAGDAAGFVLNLGFIVRGMDFAIASGEAAAKAVMAARKNKNFTRQGLSLYVQLLKQDFILRDLEAYRKGPDFLGNRRMFKEYPQLVTELASKVFTVDGTPPVHLLGKILSQVKESRVGPFQLAGDSWKGARLL
ncbi:electron transfer flavoprotein-quinone oxidoreductase FixC [Desulfocucumis palustris]|uniref:Electron transfer flavoprotein-quinone oxidoreductase FixC n=1 Tax=Desulfocucumis palustris TaxID=1898651 RepID=A0A2L2XFL0_9FIRM|nr:FAD-dependent oxidoreductase [Desulfocucumis palustris]GBF34922.1 electron transfer flavoprotein-quinone oxidoreductase FixC [Desulfocucumis palustris]